MILFVILISITLTLRGIPPSLTGHYDRKMGVTTLMITLIGISLLRHEGNVLHCCSCY